MKRWLMMAMAALSLCLGTTGAMATDDGEGRQLRHVVRFGDTLSGLAKYYGCTTEQLKALNRMKSERIVKGQRLLVPWPDPRLRVATRINVSTHEVVPGESLGTIAERYDADVRAIRLFNGLKSDKIRIGQKLEIPTAGPKLEREVVDYAIEAGDTLRSIAEKHDMQQRQVRFLNDGVDWEELKIGQSVKVFEFHVVTPKAKAPAGKDDAEVAKADGEKGDATSAQGAKKAETAKARPEPAGSCECKCDHKHAHQQASTTSRSSDDDAEDDFAYEE